MAAYGTGGRAGDEIGLTPDSPTRPQGALRRREPTDAQHTRRPAAATAPRWPLYALRRVVVREEYHLRERDTGRRPAFGSRREAAILGEARV